MGELKWPKGVFPDVEPPKPGELTVIAAPRVSGKTTFALQLAFAWSRELRVALCIPRIEMLPREVRMHPCNDFLVISHDGTISALCRELRARFGSCKIGALIIDEVWMEPDREPDPATGKRATLRTVAQELRIPVIAIVNRSVAIDAVMAADNLLVTDGKTPAATREPGVGVRWFGRDSYGRV